MQNLWGFLKDGWKIILVVLNKGQNSSLITFLHQVLFGRLTLSFFRNQLKIFIFWILLGIFLQYHTWTGLNSFSSLHLLIVSFSFCLFNYFVVWFVTHYYVFSEGEGSLHSVFKKKGWLISLEASSGDYKFDEDDDESKGTYACTSVGRLFSLSLQLTNLGCSMVCFYSTDHY